MRDLISHLLQLLRARNHLFYLLSSFGETLSPIPLRKQVWKTKAELNQNKTMFPLCNQHVVGFLLPDYHRELSSHFLEENSHWWFTLKNHGRSPQWGATFLKTAPTITEDSLGARYRAQNFPWSFLQVLTAAPGDRSCYQKHFSDKEV